MNIQTKIILRNMIRQLVIFLELANKIDEEEFRKMIPLIKAQKQSIKGVLDNAGRGNLFMMVFFIRELIETVLNDE